MAYVDDKLTQTRAMKGKRIEIPVHYDAWMQGARFGVVTGHRTHPVYGLRIVVRLLHPMDQTRFISKRVRIAAIDFDYCKVLS